MAQVTDHKTSNDAQAQEVEVAGLSPSNSSNNDEKKMEAGGEGDGYIHQEVSRDHMMADGPGLQVIDEPQVVLILSGDGLPLGWQPDPPLPLRQRTAADLLRHWWRGPIRLVRHWISNSQRRFMVRHPVISARAHLTTRTALLLEHCQTCTADATWLWLDKSLS